MNPLRTLDQRLVPALARGAGRAAAMFQRSAHADADAELDLDSAPAAPLEDVASEPDPPAGREPAPLPPIPLLDPAADRRGPVTLPAPPAPPPAAADVAGDPPRPRRMGPRVRRRRGARPAGPVRRRLLGLDERYAPRNVLRAIRAAPEVAVAVVVVLLIAIVTAALAVTPRHRAETGPCDLGQTDATAYVGPAAGQDAAGYVAQWTRQLAACAARDPGRRLYAVVSLAAARTPYDAAAALRGVSLTSVFLAVPGAVSGPAQVPVADAGNGTIRVGQAIVDAYAEVQAAASLDAVEARARAAALPVGGARTEITAAAVADELAAGRLRALCACTYAAVATGTTAQLAALATSDVRVIALAPPGTTVGGLTARPLLPSETGLPTASASPTPLSLS